MIYLYDGTETGFLCALLLAFGDGDAALASGNTQLPLGNGAVVVESDPSAADRAERRLLSFDRACMKDLRLLLRSGDPRRDLVAFRYFRLLAAKKRPIHGMYTEGAVTDAEDLLAKIRLEIHRFHGFVRFLECASGALYAPIRPDNDICDLLVPHFRARLPQFPFVIHDVGRSKAAGYDGVHLFAAPLEKAEIVLAADETAWQSLWKKYYTSVNIPSRERLKQMRGSMPARYWEFMPEKH